MDVRKTDERVAASVQLKDASEDEIVEYISSYLDSAQTFYLESGAPREKDWVYSFFIAIYNLNLAIIYQNELINRRLKELKS